MDLIDAIGAATLARRYFERAAHAACPELAKGGAPALMAGYLEMLAGDRSAAEAAAELGGDVRHQRAVRTAHRRYAQACAVERAAFHDAAQAAAWAAVEAEARARIEAGEDPERMVHCIDDNPARGLSMGLTRAEWARGGYISRYYRLGDLAGL